jgi:hypothetical protein
MLNNSIGMSLFYLKEAPTEFFVDVFLKKKWRVSLPTAMPHLTEGMQARLKPLIKFSKPVSIGLTSLKTFTRLSQNVTNVSVQGTSPKETKCHLQTS